MYIHIIKADKQCDLLQGRLVLSSGTTPHNKQNRNSLDYSQNLVMSPKGDQCQDGLTDRPTVGRKVTLTDSQLCSPLRYAVFL